MQANANKFLFMFIKKCTSKENVDILCQKDYKVNKCYV